MLNEIIGELAGGIAERVGALLGGDAATTEQAIDASVPAVLAGLAHAADHDANAVHQTVAAEGGADEDDVAGIAFGADRSAVVASVADHLGVSVDSMSAAVGAVAGGVGSYLQRRVAAEALDADGLARLLRVGRSELTDSGIGPMLASWGIGGLEAADTGALTHAHGHGSDAGFQHDDDAGRPAALWWLTAIITLVLFAIAISQCGSQSSGIDAGPAPITDASAPTTVADATPTTTVATGAGSIADVAVSQGQLNSLLNIVDAAGLAGALVGSGPITLFAPTDAAFAALGSDVIEALEADPDALQRLLLSHIADGSISSTDLGSRSNLEMLSGETVDVDSSAGIALGGAQVVDPDLVADNGTIHVVDAVIVPDGFEMPGATSGATIVEGAATAGEFSILLSALDAAGLTTTLEGDGPFTVFGPSDEAFAALPGGTVEALLERSDDLEAVLTYHVVEGEYVAEDLIPGTELTTIQGETLVVGGSGSALEVGRARVIDADIRTGNGVIHVTDAVLLPRAVFPSGEPTINYVLALQPITFATSSATITPEGEAVLDLAVAYLLETPVPVEIQGHTDSDGDDAANQTLSEARAQSVLDYLVASGVDAALLQAVGFGESQPIADNTTDDGKAQNRRIEFRVTS